MSEETNQHPPSTQAAGSESLPPVVVLHADDWRDLCEVLRSLTWGKDCMRQFHCLQARVAHRNYIPNTKLSGGEKGNQ